MELISFNLNYHIEINPGNNWPNNICHIYWKNIVIVILHLCYKVPSIHQLLLSSSLRLFVRWGGGVWSHHCLRPHSLTTQMYRVKIVYIMQLLQIMETLHNLGFCQSYGAVLRNVDVIGRQAVARIAKWRSVC